MISNNNSLKILISAYSCNPYGVSEPGVAWKQIEALISKNKFDITIITRKKNVKSIKEKLKLLEYSFVGVVGVDLPNKLLFWKKGHIAMHIYYYIWQMIAFFSARKLDKVKKFDVAHHISFMTLRTNMVPFLRPKSIVGPVGGAQIPPKGFNKILRHPIKEKIRSASIYLMSKSPFFYEFIRRADIILLANSKNLWAIPDRFRFKCCVRQIGWDINNKKDEFPENIKKSDVLNIYWGGRLIGWKGLEILLRALEIVKKEGVDALLNVTGKGPDEQYYKLLVKQLGLEGSVIFHGWVEKEKVELLQSEADVCVFTSLHETTGTALFEMMSIGKALVVVDYAGPGEIISKGGALKVSVLSGVKKSIKECAQGILALSNNQELRISIEKEAREQLKLSYSWDGYIEYIEELYEALAMDVNDCINGH